MYIRPADYYRSIQSDNLAQITNQTPGILDISEALAVEEASAYLRPKYDLEAEFRDITDFSFDAEYTVGARVQLPQAPDFSATADYAQNDLVTKDGTVYYAKAAITAAAWNASQWQALGAVGALFYVKAPEEPFNYQKHYLSGNKVTWKGRKYTAARPSPQYGHQDYLNALFYVNVPPTNILPDDPTLGTAYWGPGEDYTVTGVWPTDATKWTAGDSRDVKIVACVIDIALWHLHSRIAPRNIPALRETNYTASVEWLKACNAGDITPRLPLLPVQNNNRIRWGGQTRSINTY